MRNTLKFLVIICSAVFLLSACKAPDWWPKGVGFPPEKPKGWTGAWPPTEEKDVQFWLDIIRKEDVQDKEAGSAIGKPGDPNDAKGDGFKGNEEFVTHLPTAYHRKEGYKETEDSKPVDIEECGVFELKGEGSIAVSTCKPYPSDKVKIACQSARSVNVAKDECKNTCASKRQDGKDRVCKNYRLYTPQFFTFWYCDPDDGEANPKPEVYCRAHFLCECKK